MTVSSQRDPLREAMDRVHREMAAAGRPFPVPPDTLDEAIELEFWDRVRVLLTPEERAFYRC